MDQARPDDDPRYLPSRSRPASAPWADDAAREARRDQRLSHRSHQEPACRLCTAARGISQPVPVHLPAHHQICRRHGIWLSGPGTPQISVSGRPDILAAGRRARRLLRRCTREQLIYYKIQAPAGHDDRTWKHRTLALIETSPRQVTESCAGTVPGCRLP